MLGTDRFASHGNFPPVISNAAHSAHCASKRQRCPLSERPHADQRLIGSQGNKLPVLPLSNKRVMLQPFCIPLEPRPIVRYKYIPSDVRIHT